MDGFVENNCIKDALISGKSITLSVSFGADSSTGKKRRNMKFIILTILFAGVSFAFPQSDGSGDLLDGLIGDDNDLLGKYEQHFRRINLNLNDSFELGALGGLIEVIPSCIRAAKGVELVAGNATKLSEAISGSDNASAALSSLAAGFAGEFADQVLKDLAKANADLGEAISAQTDKTLFSLNLLDLGAINDGLDSEGSAEASFGELLNEIFDNIGASSGFSGNLSAAGEGLQEVVSDKEILIDAVASLRGVSGAAFGLVVSATQLTQSLEDAAEGLAKLSSAISSKASDLEEVDFSSLTSGLDALSHAEIVLAETVKSLSTLL